MFYGSKYINGKDLPQLLTSRSPPYFHEIRTDFSSFLIWEKPICRCALAESVSLRTLSMRYPAFESPAIAENSPMITLLSQKMTAKNTKKEE